MFDDSEVIAEIVNTKFAGEKKKRKKKKGRTILRNRRIAMVLLRL